MDILVWFWVLVEIFDVFLHLVACWLWVCYILPFYIDMYSYILDSLESLPWKDAWFQSRLLWVRWDDHVACGSRGLCPCVILCDLLHYICWNNIASAWWGSVVVDDLFFFFIENFCYYGHERGLACLRESLSSVAILASWS